MPDTAKRAADWKDWAYRTALGAVVLWGVNWLGGKIDTLSGLPAKVNQLVVDQGKLTVAVDDIKKQQTGFATGADVQALTGRVDTLTGRVDGMEATVNSLVKPVGPKR
jgi:outer membrane murein-binding lipoprotein Lpp